MNSSPIWHPFTQHGLGEWMPNVVSSSGATLHTAEGRQVLDAISSWWVTTHGHCHPRIVAAIAEQASKLDQVIFAGWTHGPAEAVATGLRSIMPAQLTRVFFSDSGSTSVEVALKMALGYWRNRREDRRRILVLEHGYHGDTIGAMSVGARGVFNRAYEPLLFDVGTIPFPSKKGPQATFDELERACAAGAAAFIVEPLLVGAGGMLTYGADVLAEMRRICAAHGVLFIADEVMTAWGRTGTLLACEHAGVVPDLLCLSKGLTGGAVPLAVTMAAEPIFEAHLSTDRASMFFHSSSYTANPIACAAAAANLEIWREEPVLARVARLTRRQAERLERIAGTPNVHNPRQLGTVTAWDMGTPAGYLSELAPRLLRFFRDHDVLLRPLGNTVYVMPPYCTTEEELDMIYDVAIEACDLLS